MSLIQLSNLVLGVSTGITVYKQQSVDYKMLGLYSCIITPYQVLNLYNKFGIVTQLHLRATKPYVHIPMTLSLISVLNLSIFGVGYVIGKVSSSAFY